MHVYPPLMAPRLIVGMWVGAVRCRVIADSMYKSWLYGVIVLLGWRRLGTRLQ